MCVCICIRTCIYIMSVHIQDLFEGISPMIMDCGKLQGESKSWSPGRGCGVVSVRSAGSRPGIGSVSSLEAGKSRCPNFKIVRQRNSVLFVEGSSFCFFQAFH